MGLDMFLYAKKYLWYDDNNEKVRINEAIPCPFSDDPKEIKYEALYWRKMNAIHKWFVDNVQEGNDDCGDYYVSKEQLTSLRDLCKSIIDTAKTAPGKIVNGYIFYDGKHEPIMEDGEIITNPEEVSALCPTEGGFFFGSTAYDGYYLSEIRRTKEMLDKILNSDLKGWSFEYHSSW